MTELSPHTVLFDLRDVDCRIGLRAILAYRRRQGELCEQDRELERRLDELDREQAKGER